MGLGIDPAKNGTYYLVTLGWNNKPRRTGFERMPSEPVNRLIFRESQAKNRASVHNCRNIFGVIGFYARALSFIGEKLLGKMWHIVLTFQSNRATCESRPIVSGIRPVRRSSRHG